MPKSLEYHDCWDEPAMTHLVSRPQNIEYDNSDTLEIVCVKRDLMRSVQLYPQK